MIPILMLSYYWSSTLAATALLLLFLIETMWTAVLFCSYFCCCCYYLYCYSDHFFGRRHILIWRTRIHWHTTTEIYIFVCIFIFWLWSLLWRVVEEKWRRCWWWWGMIYCCGRIYCHCLWLSLFLFLYRFFVSFNELWFWLVSGSRTMVSNNYREESSYYCTINIMMQYRLKGGVLGWMVVVRLTFHVRLSALMETYFKQYWPIWWSGTPIITCTGTTLIIIIERLG